MSRSWFREWVIRARPSARRLEQAVEARTLLAWQAELTWRNTQTAIALLSALANVSDAVMRIDALLLVKRDGAVYCNILTLEQVHKLEHEPHLQQDPAGILAALGLTEDGSQRIDIEKLPG
jgi:hypothetical protein